MDTSIYHRLSRFLWGVTVTLVVCLALYVSVGRLVAANVGSYRELILAELNSRVPFNIEAEGVTAEWHSFSPELVLTGLRLGAPGQDEQPVALSEGRIGLDVWGSLWTRSLQATWLELEQLSLRGELDADGSFRITGFAGGGGDISGWIEAFLLNIERIHLNHNSLNLTVPSGESRNFDLDFSLSRTGSRRHVRARLESTRGAVIHAVADGVGSPLQLELFRGDLYIELVSGDLEAMGSLFAGETPATWADGTVDVEVWLSLDRGEAEIESHVAARDLLIRTGGEARQFPIERVEFSSTVLRRKNRWTLYAEDMLLEQGGDRVSLPRLQGDFWGKALRLRMDDVQLAPLHGVISAIGVLPQGLADVSETLDPGGRLDALQVNISDWREFLADWEVNANFSELQVNSWKGAPGVTAASGYIELAAGGGFLVLDAQQFTMEFPTVYQRPLKYDDLHGTLYFDWDEEAVTLSSGLIQATASEGTAQALFALNIPLQPSTTGLEMELLVGVEDVHPRYRAKYVPYILNENLQNWLKDSVGEGTVEEGAFLWRGSLRRQAHDLRTIQLFFNVSDTNLEYHPQWPPVSGVAGTVLIDDTNVSVWADQATLYNSSIEGLSAEASLNAARQIELAVHGVVHGPAADGLRVLNESPLRQYVGDTFSAWKMEGALETRLDLLLNLADKTIPPQVEVSTLWDDVSVDIQPGRLPVRAVTGQFNYTTEAGFSSSDLRGELWGEPLFARVSQQPALSQGAASDSVVQVDIAGTVDPADIRDWLALDFLTLAQGKTEVALQLTVAPGNSVRLAASSDLAGVSLDLPPPWILAANETQPLSLDLPLSGGISPMNLSLGEDLRMIIDVQDGKLVAGSLTLDGESPALESGELRVTGSANFLDGDAWNEFLENYFSAGFLPGDDAAEDTDPEQARLAAEETAFPTIVLDDVRAQHLRLLGRDFQDVILDLNVDSNGWRATAQMDWVSGSLQVEGDEPWQLRLEDLDLAGVSGLFAQAATETEADSDLELPVMDVVATRLRHGDLELGSMDFHLHRVGPTLKVSDIHGELAGMRVPVEEPGQLVWLRGEEGDTQLDLALQFEDIGLTLMELGYEKILETESGRFDISMKWPGAPQAFSIAAASGSVLVDVEKGSFLEASAGATGALKVVSILNLASIVQRLSVSQMFDSGIPFDSMDGEFYLHGGTIEVPTLDVRGASSRFQFNGLSDVESRSLEGKLVATLPVASNLPWVAALAGGLPVAAGVFVVSKLFEKQFDLLSSAVYDIGGTWNEPKVEFDRIWDDGASSSRKKKAVPQPPGEPNDPQDLSAPDTQQTEMPDPQQIQVLDPQQIQAQDPQEIPLENQALSP